MVQKQMNPKSHFTNLYTTKNMTAQLLNEQKRLQLKSKNQLIVHIIKSYFSEKNIDENSVKNLINQNKFAMDQQTAAFNDLLEIFGKVYEEQQNTNRILGGS